MRERLALLAVPVLLAVVAGGCGDEATSETEVPATPIAAVADWLGAVANEDVATIDRLVDPVDLALLAGAENAFTHEQLAAVAATGLPEATRSSYWSSFAEGFEDVLGMPLDEVTITGAEEFTSEGERYAAVTVGVGDATTEVITHLVDGAWQVDMVASAGPALAVPIRRLVTDLAASEDEATARTYAQAAVSSLSAAHAWSADRSLELELEAIEGLAVAAD
jgi:hypothetical protein